jgi:hypothetical protein
MEHSSKISNACMQKKVTVGYFYSRLAGALVFDICCVLRECARLAKRKTGRNFPNLGKDGLKSMEAVIRRMQKDVPTHG